jgi:hypothetical protein
VQEIEEKADRQMNQRLECGSGVADPDELVPLFLAGSVYQGANGWFIVEHQYGLAGLQTWS